MLTRITWLLRATACVLVGWLTFVTKPPHGADLALELTVYLVGLAVTAGWFASEKRERGEAVLPYGLAVMAASGGVAGLAPHGGALVAFTFIAVLAGGTLVDERAGWVVVGAAVVGVEVGAISYGASTGYVVGYPLLLAASFLGGRNRRSAIVQSRQAAELATLDERNRIAREIHDVLAHSLGALGIQLQAARAVLEADDVAKALELLERAQRMATDGLVDTRRAVQALRGDSQRLDEQLTALVADHRVLHDTPVALRIEGTPCALPAESTVALIRTAQEGLVNTAKHAPHQPVDVSLAYEPHAVSLTLGNDLGGHGGTMASIDGGYGLRGLRERLLLRGGTLTAEAGDGRWTVSATVPR